MTALFFRIDAWMMSLLLAALLVGAWLIGFRLGRIARRRGDDKGVAKIGDASLALMGLLLGFTFSMSLQKHDTRRLSVLSDSNSIGDFYTAACMTREPTRSQLCKEIKSYAQHRLSAIKPNMSAAEVEDSLSKIGEMHARMADLVRQAIEGGDLHLATVLVNTLNGVTSNHAARLASLRDLLPGTVVLLLFVATITAVGLLGRQEGVEDRVHARTMVLFVTLIVCVIYVTLDLNQAQRGLIRVSQEPMERLITSMK